MSITDSERSGLVWRKATSSAHNGACVQVAAAAGGIAVRDSKNPDGPILLYTPNEWRAFLDGAKNGEFDQVH
jgi:hypothetical protein